MAEMSFNPNHTYYINDLKAIAEKVDWQYLCNKNVAVTGATGLLGSLIIDFLLYINKNFDAKVGIIALGRNIEKIKNRFSYALDSGYLKLALFELNGVFPNIDVEFIIHCAGNSHPQIFAEDPVGTIMGNILGAEKVLNYASKYKARVLLLSSGEIYGDNCDWDYPMTEDYNGKLDLTTSRSCYSEGKRAVESLCQSYIAEYGVNAVIARPCRIFGPTMTSADNKASAQFFRRGLSGKDIILKSSGDQKFSYIYSADAVSALLTILIRGKIGEAINVANDYCNIRLKDFAKKVSEKANVKLTYDITGEPGGSKVTNAILSSKKLQSLGWTPSYDISTGIEQTFRILSTYEN